MVFLIIHANREILWFPAASEIIPDVVLKVYNVGKGFEIFEMISSRGKTTLQVVSFYVRNQLRSNNLQCWHPLRIFDKELDKIQLWIRYCFP